MEKNNETGKVSSEESWKEKGEESQQRTAILVIPIEGQKQMRFSAGDLIT